MTEYARIVDTPYVDVLMKKLWLLPLQASDFGALEVHLGASIGHTCPWTISDAIRAQQQQAEREEGPRSDGAACR